VIYLELEQGSVPWLEARIGIPTASQFHRIITPKTMKLSEQSTSYRNELLAETLLGVSLSEELSQLPYVDRGAELEPQARAFYEFERGVEVRAGGFCLLDNRRAGCSPDGLIDTDGCLEMKCPSPAVHVGYLLEGTEKYRTQIQGQLWITEREWADFLSYHPTLPPALVRVERDEKFIAALASCVNQFCDYLEEGKEKLRVRGLLREAVAA
jgi:hypothetical protein